MAAREERNVIQEAEGKVELAIYIAPHCGNCDYALTVAAQIRQDYPDVSLRVVDVSIAEERVPEAVFATPTYLLNGRVWSLGNPSQEKIEAALGRTRP